MIWGVTLRNNIQAYGVEPRLDMVLLLLLLLQYDKH